MGSFMSSQPHPDEERGFPWHIVAGVVAVVVALGTAVLLSRSDPSANAELPTDPYAENLSLGDIQLSTAENFVGGAVTYIDGKIINNGEKVITGITAEVTFRNSLGEVVQKEQQALKVLHTGGPVADIVSFAQMPLRPGQSATWRTTWEHISNDWNRGYPELRIVKVTASN
jgi:hypothetical protein